MPTLSVNVVDQCPDLLLQDTSDYSDQDVVGTYMFHDYVGAGAPAANTAFTLSSLTVNGVEVLGTTINISTDASQDLVDVLNDYNLTVDNINSFQSLVAARLIQPDPLDYQTWYIELYNYDTSYNGYVVASTTTLTPLISNMTFVGQQISGRNLHLLLPDGETYADLGATTQVDTITLVQSSYVVGETFTLSFCSTNLQYTVVEGITSASCIAVELTNLINAQTTGDWTRATATASGNTLIINSKIPGNPMYLAVSYTQVPVGDYITVATTTANIPSLDMVSLAVSNEITYTPQEDGGLYKLGLTAFTDATCTYQETELDFYNWCYDLINLECCLVDTIIGESSCCGSASPCYGTNAVQAADLYSKIGAIRIMETKGEPGDKIQCVVDSAKSICNQLSCSCQ